MDGSRQPRAPMNGRSLNGDARSSPPRPRRRRSPSGTNYANSTSANTWRTNSRRGRRRLREHMSDRRRPRDETVGQSSSAPAAPATASVTGPQTVSERWREAMLAPEATLQDAIRNLNMTSLQIVLVVAGDGTLLGTITDGDIRRGLLRGSDLTSPIGAIAFRDPLVVPPQLGRESVLQLMQANRLRQVPVVDEQRR